MPNNSRRGSMTWPPPSGDPLMVWPQRVPYAPPPATDDRMLLGLIFERSTATADVVLQMREDIGDMKERLIKGDSRFETIETNIRDMKATKDASASKPASPPAPSLTQAWAPSIIKSALGVALLAVASSGVLPMQVAEKIAMHLFGAK